MQPSSGYQYKAIAGGTAASTTVLKSTNAVLKSVVVPGTYVGSLVIYNSATAAGTTSSNQVISLGLPATAVPFTLPVDIEFNSGLTYTASGTPSVILVWN